MAQFPALTLWTDAYLSDTRHLSTLEHGAYLLLLMEAWRRPNCDLPDDDRFLARLAGVGSDEWAALKPVVMEFWTRDGRSKTWKQKRLTKERDAAKKRSKSQRDKIAKRWDKTKKADTAEYTGEYRGNTSTATATVEDKEANASSSSTREARSKKKTDQPFIRPDWVPRGPWDAFVAMRVRIRKPMTDHAKNLAVGELAKLAKDGHPPGDVLNQSTLSSYQGLFPLKEHGNGNGPGNRSNAPRHHGERDNRDGFERAIDRNREARLEAERRSAGESAGLGLFAADPPAALR